MFEPGKAESGNNGWRGLPLTKGPSLKCQIETFFRQVKQDESEVMLVRHAEPAPSALKVTRGEDPLLSCTGLSQARLLAERLDNLVIDAVFSAPERRARQTASVICEVTETVPQTLAELKEADSFTNSAAPNTACRSSDTATPGSAVDATTAERLRACIEIEVGRQRGRRLVFVTHASVISAFLATALGLNPGRVLPPEHASVSVLRRSGDIWLLHSLNDTSHLADSMPAW